MDMKESLSPATSSPPSEEMPLDDALLSSGNSSGEDDASTNQSDSPMDGGGRGGRIPRTEGPTTSNLAKFKASQDLRIQTANLPPKASGKSKPRAQSVGSAAGMGLADEEEGDEGSADGGKTPVPAPCSTGKKRRRRTAAQIDRKYPCTYPGCTKAYGSEGSLTQHQRLKHRNQSPEPGVQAAQLNNFFLPLHRTPRGLAGTIGRPTSGVGGARTVTIRPAGIDGLTLHSFDVAAAAAASLVAENDTVASEFLLPSPSQALGHARQQLRARSNSMPISFSTPSALSMHYASQGLAPPPPPLSVPLGPPSSASSAGDSTPSSGAKPKSTRRSRPAGTPRSGGRPPMRRAKGRSKSESLQEAMAPLSFHDDIRRPSMDRSASDHAARSFPLSANAAMGGPPFDWRFAIAQSQQSESPVSSVEEAIDSDILSVLADYDTSDAGDSSLELVGTHGFEDATESSYASSSGGRFQEPEDEWLSQQDAQYLTTHLEKMSMIHDSPPGSLGAHVMVPEDDPMHTVKMEFPTTLEDQENLKHAFPEVSLDAFAVNPVDLPFVAGEDMKDGGLKLHGPSFPDSSSAALLLDRELFEPLPPSLSSGGFKQEQVPMPLPAPVPAMPLAPQQPTWTKELNALETYASSGIDQADYMDVDSTSYGPLHWKTTEKLRPTASQAAYTGSFDSLTAYLQHGDKHGTFPTLGDSFALDSIDYAMEEPRLSSPVICQQQDL